jgi:hypothetical protein
MLEIIARLLIALAVAAGAQGVGTADEHASPEGNAKAIAAIEAFIAKVSAVAEETEAAPGEQPETTGLDRATEVADEHAADGLDKAADAKAAGQAKADAAKAAGQAKADAAKPADAPDVEAPPVEAPPVDMPPVSGPPATHPPVAAPPVPAPPVDAPGQGNRP